MRERQFPIWADKFAFAFAVILAAIALMLSIILCVGAGTFTDTRLIDSLASWTGAIELVFAVPLWIGLRLVDLATGGPWRRRRHRAEHAGSADLRKEPTLFAAQIAQPASAPDEAGD